MVAAESRPPSDGEGRESRRDRQRQKLMGQALRRDVLFVEALGATLGTNLTTPELMVLPRKKTTGHGTPWTEEHVEELKMHSKARTPVAKISKIMKRTEGALRRKAGILRIGLEHDR